MVSEPQILRVKSLVCLECDYMCLLVLKHCRYSMSMKVVNHIIYVK